MVRAGEDLDELGGYFIINGNERVLRFVIQQKTNYPIALKRESFRNREIFATDLAILLRSQRQAVHTCPGVVRLLFDGAAKGHSMIKNLAEIHNAYEPINSCADAFSSAIFQFIFGILAGSMERAPPTFCWIQKTGGAVIVFCLIDRSISVHFSCC